MSDRKLLGVIIAGQDSAITDRIKQIIEDEVEIDFLGATADLESSIELIAEKEPDVVILDIQIGPDTTSNGIMKLLITMRLKFPDLVIMVLSNSVHSRLNCIAYGADYFFDKSYEFYGIPKAIKSIQMKCPE
jgi:DNA-binding NarL/FixJ family response regulator